MKCPRCKSSLLNTLSCNYVDDEQGCCQKEICSYKCLNCGCHFKVIEETIVRYEIDSDIDEYK